MKAEGKSTNSLILFGDNIDDMNIFENQRCLYMPTCRNFRLLNLPFRYWMFNVYDGYVPMGTLQMELSVK